MRDAFVAHRCADGHWTYPGHRLCPECGADQVETVDLSGRTATVVTWTTSHSTPPGVREPNHLAIVEFDLSGERGGDAVRALVQLTDDDVAIGDEVRPTHVEQLRDPDAGIREPESQDWDGYRFDPS
ncbi:Zn-ribbon domain-containing OB-fold protein [Halorarius halobius]|uniref:Zn-ribbon domain-containing OB-fold protein n=1 Tax=Halorarius halobius TaxID=2962671 RepID=UPI0020CD4A83|nr:OB-fold domain-containing protein [Halorarius halobius]